MATIYPIELKSGATRYKVDIRIAGLPRRVRTFGRLTDARLWAQQIEAEARRNDALRRARFERRTLGELLDHYEAEILTGFRPRYRQQRKTHLRFWERHLGRSRKLRALRRPEIADGLRKLRDGHGPSGRRLTPATRNRYLASLQVVLAFAVREEWIERNPARGLHAKEPRGRTRFLDQDELHRLLDAVRGQETLELLVVLAVSTGARQGELLGLRWRDIDLGRQQAVVHHTKNGDRRILPLHGRALELLRERSKLRRIDDDRLFSGGRGRTVFPRTSWLNAVNAAGLVDLRFHDLRHTAASHLAMRGATLTELAEILGHRSLQMVKRYAHLTEAHTHELVRRMNVELLG